MDDSGRIYVEYMNSAWKRSVGRMQLVSMYTYSWRNQVLNFPCSLDRDPVRREKMLLVWKQTLTKISLFHLLTAPSLDIQWGAKKIAVVHMHFFELYLSSIWTDSSKTFLRSQGDAIECSVSKTSAKVSLCRPRGIIIRMSPAFSMYRAVILHYRDCGNRWAVEIVFLAKISVHNI